MAANRLLVAAGILDFLAALVHLACIPGGPSWYRVLGAGPRVVREAERGLWMPTAMAVGIAAVLVVWGLYAWGAAGVTPRLPFTRFCLAIIALVYLARGSAPFAVVAATQRPMTPFWVWSSLIVLGFGLVHAVGAAQVWRRL